MSQFPPPVPPPVPPAQYARAYWRSAPGGGFGGYPVPVRSMRPGVVSAIGAFSIIIASLTLFTSLLTGLYGFRMFRVSQMSAQMNRGASATSSTSIVPPGMVGQRDAGVTAAPAEPVVGPEGMREKDRRTVADVLQTMQAIPPQRLRQLEWILAQAGRQVFPSGPTGVSEERVSAAVTDYGTEPTANPEASPPLYFDTSSGRLLLYDNHAVFRPNATGGRVVRSAAPLVASPGGQSPGAQSPNTQSPGGQPPAPATAPSSPGDPFDSDPNDPFAATSPPPGGPGANVPGPGGLTPAEVEQVIQAAQKAANGRLNPAQLAAVRQVLAMPGQQLVTRQQVWSPVSMVQMQQDGSAVVRLGGGFLFLDAQGTVMSSMSTLMPRLAIHPLSIALVIGESVASAGLAIYLLVVAILTLRDSPRGRRYHQIYAAIKIPLGVTGAVAFAWLMTGLLTSLRTLNPGMGGGGFTPRSVQVMMTLGILVAVAGLIYPVVLLIVLRTRTVKDYYDPATTAG